MKSKIAVLLTCFNRREKTLACLSSLFNSSLLLDSTLDVFLVDDGSTDGTSQTVKEKYPNVIIIQGNGNLYWNHGMRLAWETAAKTKKYDYYLWLNDDTILNSNALIELLECSNEAFKKDNKPVIITGACRESLNENKFTYGGRTETGPVIPNGSLQECLYINGNVVLIPYELYHKLGNLSPNYSHAIGDLDYGLRAKEAGFKCYTSRSYIALCSTNCQPEWSNPDIPLKNRLKILYSIKGLNLMEYLRFIKKYRGLYYMINLLFKIYFRVLFPRTYIKLKKTN